MMKKRFLLSIIIATFAMGEVLAEDMPETDKVVFDAASGTLTLPKVYVMGADGNVSEKMYKADMKIIEGSDLEFKVEDLKESDDHGCFDPESWHAEMGHCMVQ